MTYKKFCDITYFVEKEKDFYCWANVVNPPDSKNKEKYDYFRQRAEKINKFKKEVLTKALAKLPDDYFDK